MAILEYLRLNVSIVKNGKIIGRYKEESTGDDNITPDKYWTNERIERTFISIAWIYESTEIMTII